MLTIEKFSPFASFFVSNTPMLPGEDHDQAKGYEYAKANGIKAIPKNVRMSTTTMSPV